MKAEPLRCDNSSNNIDSQGKEQFLVTLYLLQATVNIDSHGKKDKTIQEDIAKNELCEHEVCGVFLFPVFHLNFIR